MTETTARGWDLRNIFNRGDKKDSKSTSGGEREGIRARFSNWLSNFIKPVTDRRARKVEEHQAEVEAEYAGRPEKSEKQTGSNVFMAVLKLVFFTIIWKKLVRILLRSILLFVYRLRYVCGIPKIQGGRYIAIRRFWKGKNDLGEWKAYLYAPFSPADFILWIPVLIQAIVILFLCNDMAGPSQELVMFTLAVFAFNGVLNAIEIVRFFAGVASSKIDVKSIRYSIIGNIADILLSFSGITTVLVAIFLTAQKGHENNMVMIVNYDNPWIVFVVQWFALLYAAMFFIVKPMIVWIFAKLIARSTKTGTRVMPRVDRKEVVVEKPKPVVAVASTPVRVEKPEENRRRVVETQAVSTPTSSAFGSQHTNGNLPSWFDQSDEEDDDDESVFGDNGDRLDDDHYDEYCALIDHEIIGAGKDRGQYGSLVSKLKAAGLEPAHCFEVLADHTGDRISGFANIVDHCRSQLAFT